MYNYYRKVLLWFGFRLNSGIKQTLRCLTFISLIIFTSMNPINAKEKQLILVVGDSLSAAYEIPTEFGWVNLMAQKVEEEGLPYRVLNESISGDTSGNGLYRMREIVQREKKIDHLVLALGANDGLRGLPFQQIKMNLAIIMDLAIKNGAKVLLVGINLPPNYGSFYKKKFDEVYIELAKEYKINLLPSLLQDLSKTEEYFQEDRLHPNENGQLIILRTVWGELKKQF